MLKKLIVIAALVSLLTFAGCTQEQASPSAGASSRNDATASVSSQPSMTSSESVGQSGESSASASDEAGELLEASATSAEAPDSFVISVGKAQLAMMPADTDAARALAEQLQSGPVTVSLHAYGGFEKVGPLPWSLPASDEQITTQPGDVMLYQGNQITIFTGSNSWDYTPLGRIEDATPESLLEVLGEGDVEISLSLR